MFRPVVLCYHAVSARWPHPLAVTLERLARHVAGLLRRGYAPATAGGVAQRPGGRLLHVTFDDALTSVIRALPVLERLGVPATVFACPGRTGAPLGVPELAGEEQHELTTLDWDGLRALCERDVEIGSHTVSHPHLPELSDAEIERELVESRRQLEDELGVACRTLAYPYGEHDERCRRIARAAGYETAFAIPRFRSGTRQLRADPYALPRVGLFGGDGLLKARLRTSLLARRAAALAA